MTAQEDQEIGAVVDDIVASVGSGQGDRELDEDQLRKVVVEAGLWRVALPEEHGGSGGVDTHLAAVIRRLGYHAVRVPLLEDHLGAEAVAACGIPVPERHTTYAVRHDLEIARTGDRVTVSGSCRHVPWGRTASFVVAVVADSSTEQGADTLVVLLVDEAQVTTGENLAGEPRDRLTFVAVEPVAMTVVASALDTLHARALTFRSVQMLGAAEHALELTVDHVTGRIQFGSALSRRQTVQHAVAEMFGAVTAVSAGSAAAVASLANRSADDLGLGRGEDMLPAALATRVEADRMASLVSRLSHQLHGAIGFTQEHALHHSTLRLNAWRQDELGEEACAIALARSVTALGGPWETLTGVRWAGGGR